MRNSATPLYVFMLLIGDFVALLSAFVVAYVLRVNIDDRPLIAAITAEQYVKIFLLLIPFWLLVFASLGLYRREVFEQKLPETFRLVIGSFIGILVLIGYEFVTLDTVFPARLVAVYGLVGAFLLLFFERSILRWLRRYLYKFNIGVRKVMLVGSTKATTTLAKLLHDSEKSGSVVEVVIGQKNMLPDNFTGQHYSNLHEALDNINKLDVNTIIQTQLFEDESKNKRILLTARQNHLAYRFIPTQDEFYTGNHSVELFHGFPVIAVHQTKLLGWERIVKRGFDIIFSLVALPFIALFYLVFGLVVKLTDSAGPVIYKTTRVTRFGTKFKAYKFRTMYWRYSTRQGGKTDAEILTDLGRPDLAAKVQDGDMQVDDDPRVMPIGRFLRRTSLDEVPQFLNVLNGHMSVVGPRAITPRDMQLYKEEGSVLLNVKTGITGLAQVSGRSNISYEERAKLNLYYVQNWSLLLDLRVILRTVLVILKGGTSR